MMQHVTVRTPVGAANKISIGVLVIVKRARRDIAAPFCVCHWGRVCPNGIISAKYPKKRLQDSQDGYKGGPTWAKMGSRKAQVSPKKVQVSPKMDQDGSEMGPRGGQHGPGRGKEKAKLAPKVS